MTAWKNERRHSLDDTADENHARRLDYGDGCEASGELNDSVNGDSNNKENSLVEEKEVGAPSVSMSSPTKNTTSLRAGRVRIHLYSTTRN